MQENLIACPKCNTRFPLNSAIEQPIVERLRAEFTAEVSKKEAALQTREALIARQNAELAREREGIRDQVQSQLETERKKIAVDLEKRAKEAVSIQMADLQQQLVEKDRAIATSQQEQLSLLKQKRQLETDRETFEIEKQKQIDAERKKITAELEGRAKEAVSLQMADLQQQLLEKDRAIATSKQEQLDLLKQKRQLEADRGTFEIEKQKQLDAERQKICDEAAKNATEQLNTELLALRQTMAMKEQKLAEAQAAELALRKQKSELEAERKALDLEMARRGDAIKEAVAREIAEDYRLKEAEKNKQLDDMRRQIDELRRKADQGSQQTQGEVLELDLEKTLATCFHGDEILPVPKGTHGGDLLHTVRDGTHPCGTIIWEVKRTKAWQDVWLGKLKDDKLAAKAHIALLVSVTMPKEVATFECRENVWIAPPALAIPLAYALRHCLIESSAAKRAGEGRHDKMTEVYDYIAGPDFKARISAVFETFKAMRDDLDSEKKAMMRIWSKREKQLERVLANTVTLHGELQGIIGQSLPQIESMELDAIADEQTVLDGTDPAQSLVRRE